MFLLKNTVGTVNFTDFLHVTCSKVASPGVILWEDWIDAPVSNVSFAIPVADADNYYVRYYDAPTNASLGTLHLELIVNALTNEVLYERRWYLVDGPGDYDPSDGATSLTDPYLINKTIYGVFKEGFRYFKEGDEYTSNGTIGEIAIVNGTQWAAGERIMVEIKYAAAQTATSASGGLYAGTIEVSEQERTLLVDELNARIVCAGTDSTQKFILPLIDNVPDEAGFYFDNSVKGTAIQPVIHCNGTDKIKFNGFMAPSDLFTDLWVSKGEHMLLRKRSGFWEVITDYKGTNVGEKISAGFKSHPNFISENGQLVDGEIYGRLWWWVTEILPATHKYTDDTVGDPGWTPNADRIGQFAVHSTEKLFRMPKTNGLVQKGLKDFEVYGTDVANRPVDYPGGFEAQKIQNHRHNMTFSGTGAGAGLGFFLKRFFSYGNNGDYVLQSTTTEPDILQTSNPIGGNNKAAVENVGVIFGRRI